MPFQHFSLSVENHVAQLAFNRPGKANSLHLEAWDEMKAAFRQLDQDPEVRVVILKGEGKHFCAGIDLKLLMNMGQFADSCPARQREQIRSLIIHLQACITSIEQCRKPVLAAIHGSCIGGGVDIASACDIRYCTDDALFCIEEINLGLVADIGTLQRLPKIIHPGIMAELAYTGRKVQGPEAQHIGLVNQSYPKQEAMMEAVEAIAQQIASKSPVCIRGTKDVLQYTRDHSVADALNYMVAWNAGMLLSNDIFEALAARMQKRTPKFEA